MSIKVDNKKFTIALTKVAVDVFDGKFYSAVKGAIDTATAFTKEGPGDPTAEEGARLLLQRGAYAAAMRTIQIFAREAPVLAAEADPKEIEAELSGLAAGTPLELTKDAFTDPERWPALAAVLDAFAGWQKACGVAEDKREPMRLAFREEFALALAGELRDRDKEADYRDLLTEVTRSTPLDAAAQRALDGQAYRARLVEAVHKPLRLLDPEIPSRSLHDLYVPLRASVGEPLSPIHRPENGKPIPIRWLDSELDAWIDKADSRDAVRVLSGEPGSGKSSACAMLAARLARKGLRVLLVPLGRLNYRGAAQAELSRFVGEELGHDALERARNDGGPPLVLILDGLDELAKAGQGAVTMLSGFVSSLSVVRSEWNQKGLRVLLLLAGRPGAAEATDPIARADGARLHVLRYRIERSRQDWFDDKALAELDQRPEWWRRFGHTDGSPEVLKQSNPHLASLTEQPLLNWLVAQILILEGAERAATIDGIHDLYTRLFRRVLDRVHRRSDHAALEATDSLERKNLEWMLEEVAVAAWHSGGDRTVPFPVVRERLEKAELDRHLDRLTDNHDDALTTLLDSFFCRAHAGQTHRTVEFTHKSFGQFLTARRIVREVADIHDAVALRGNSSNRLNCLRDWLALCGPAAMDLDLLNFLRAETASVAGKRDLRRDVDGWRAPLTSLFQDCVILGMPLPSGDFRARDAERRVRNAEVTLLAALDATVRATLEPPGRSVVRLMTEELWKSKQAAATLHRLLGPPQDRSVAGACLPCLNLEGADLWGASLRGTNLTDVNLTDANLERADLWGTDLTGANLRGTYLMDADLMETDLTNADLTNADLRDTDLKRANLMDADLKRANLRGADLTDADLRGADLTNADLTDADLKRANLRGADLTGVCGDAMQTTGDDVG